MKGFSWTKEIRLQGKLVGKGAPAFIVAEAGVAHFGSVQKALQLVDLAFNAGADAVKFQVFKSSALVSRESPEWLDRMKSRELPFGAFREIQLYCREKGIIFFATAHDEPSLEYLAGLEVPVFKVGSGEVENWPFLEKVAHLKRPVFLSTGMYTLDHIRKALEIFAVEGNPDLAVLHCVTQYPTPPSQVNLRAMDLIRSTFNILTGYSDHTAGFHIPLAAAALGATVIEKHIALDFNVPNAQDWKVACGEKDFAEMVRKIREIEASLEGYGKAPTEGERVNLDWARKSLVAARDIAFGEEITADMIQMKRPGTGISPARMREVVGRKARESIPKDCLIGWEKLT